MKQKMVRASFTLPPQMLADLAAIAERVGVSRSALLADLSTEPLADLRGLLDLIPVAPEPTDMRRLRGKSEELIEKRLAALRELDDGLFPASDKPS